MNSLPSFNCRHGKSNHCSVDGTPLTALCTCNDPFCGDDHVPYIAAAPTDAEILAHYEEGDGDWEGPQGPEYSEYDAESQDEMDRYDRMEASERQWMRAGLA